MDNNPADIIYLLKRFSDKTASEKELQTLFELVQTQSSEEDGIAFLQNALNTHELSGNDKAYWEEKLDVKAVLGAAVPTVHRTLFLRTAWFRYAAIILLLAGTATFLYVNK